MVIRVVPNFVVLFGAVAGSVMTMKLAIQLDKIPNQQMPFLVWKEQHENLMCAFI